MEERDDSYPICITWVDYRSYILMNGKKNLRLLVKVGSFATKALSQVSQTPRYLISLCLVCGIGSYGWSYLQGEDVAQSSSPSLFAKLFLDYIDTKPISTRVVESSTIEIPIDYGNYAYSGYHSVEQDYLNVDNFKAINLVNHNLNELMQGITLEQIDKIKKLNSYDSLEDDPSLSYICAKAQEFKIPLNKLQAYVIAYEQNDCRIEQLNLDEIDQQLLKAQITNQSQQEEGNCVQAFLQDQQLTFGSVELPYYKENAPQDTDNLSSLVDRAVLEQKLADPDLTVREKAHALSLYAPLFPKQVRRKEEFDQNHLDSLSDQQLLFYAIAQWKHEVKPQVANLVYSLQEHLSRADNFIARQQYQQEQQQSYNKMIKAYETKADSELAQVSTQELESKQSQLQKNIDLAVVQDNEISSHSKIIQLDPLALYDSLDLSKPLVDKSLPNDFVLSNQERSVITQQLAFLQDFLQDKLSFEQSQDFFKVQFAKLNTDKQGYIFKLALQEANALLFAQNLDNKVAKYIDNVPNLFQEGSVVAYKRLYQISQLNSEQKLILDQSRHDKIEKSLLAKQKISSTEHSQTKGSTLDKPKSTISSFNLTASLQPLSTNQNKDLVPFFKQTNLLLDPNFIKWLNAIDYKERTVFNQVTNNKIHFFRVQYRSLLDKVYSKQPLSDQEIQKIIQIFYPPLSPTEFVQETAVLHQSNLGNTKVLASNKLLSLFLHQYLPDTFSFIENMVLVDVTTSEPHIQSLKDYFQNFCLPSKKANLDKEPQEQMQVSVLPLLGSNQSLEDSWYLEDDKIEDLFTVNRSSYQPYQEVMEGVLSSQTVDPIEDSTADALSNEQQLAQIREDTRRLQEYYFKRYQQQQMQKRAL